MCSFEQIGWSSEVKWYLCIVTNTCLCFKAIIAIARISEGVIIDHKISNCVYLYAHNHDLQCKLCLILNTSVCFMVRIICSSIYSWVWSIIACSLKLIIRTSSRFFLNTSLWFKFITMSNNKNNIMSRSWLCGSKVVIYIVKVIDRCWSKHLIMSECQNCMFSKRIIVSCGRNSV